MSILVSSISGTTSSAPMVLARYNKSLWLALVDPGVNRCGPGVISLAGSFSIGFGDPRWLRSWIILLIALPASLYARHP